jgi:glycosyltransferase involved in cell wall biosynthesis
MTSSTGPLRVLTFTTLYPNEAQPSEALFVEQRLRQLRATGEVESRVVAPVPWFPFGGRSFGRYSVFARVPGHELRGGIAVDHPRYVVVPKVGMNLAPLLLARGAWPTIRRLRSQFDFDVIDAHFYYPDGVAAAIIARRLGKPLVITARGSDINLYRGFTIPRRWLRWAATQAAASIGVSTALVEAMRDLGFPAERLHVLRNGVDLHRFAPQPRDAARARLGWHTRTLLSVGHLEEIKGHHLAIEALQGLPGWQLVIVGSGEWHERLLQIARQQGVADRVQLVGSVAQQELPLHYSAADLLVLASSREGLPNVLLESLACGTPVIATRVGGSPEVVRAPEAGALLDERSAAAIMAAVRRFEAAPIDREATQRYSRQFDWGPTIAGLLQVLRSASRPAHSTAT